MQAKGIAPDFSHWVGIFQMAAQLLILVKSLLRDRLRK